VTYRSKVPIFCEARVTAVDLTEYIKAVLRRSGNLPSRLRYMYDGKVNPTKYGSIQKFDLGLCYETFYMLEACRLEKTASGVINH
jgi:hypothetical protein